MEEKAGKRGRRMIPKYYCQTCGKFKNRNEVKKIKVLSHIAIFIRYECKYCHKQVEESKTVLERIIKESEEEE